MQRLGLQSHDRGRSAPCRSLLWPSRRARRRDGVALLALLASVLAVATVGCRVRRDVPEQPDAAAAAPSASSAAPSTSSAATVETPPALEPVEPPPGVLVIAMGGVGSRPDQSTTALAAVDQAIRALADGSSEVDAAALATAVMEDDPSFNAGTGSTLRIGSATPSMDAAVMTEDGRFGAVVAIENVQNPVLVALRVVDSPSPVLVGAGATAMARLMGMPPYDPATQLRRQQRSELLAELAAAFARRRAAPELDGGTAAADAGRAASDGGVPAHDNGGMADAATPSFLGADGGFDWEAYASRITELEWLDGGAPPDEGSDGDRDGGPGGADAPAASDANGGAPSRPAADTVAVLVRGPNQRFAGAVSSGGPALALPGRLGDLARPGGALHVGTIGAVAVSGPAEAIAKLQLAQRIYDRLERTRSAQAAADWGAKQLGGDEAVAILVLDGRQGAIRSRADVAWARRSADETSTGMPEDAGAPTQISDGGSP